MIPCIYAHVQAESLQSCPTLCHSTDYSLPGSSVHRILQVKILEWVAMPSTRGSSWPRDRTQVSHIAGRFFTIWATRETHLKCRKMIKTCWMQCPCVLRPNHPEHTVALASPVVSSWWVSSLWLTPSTHLWTLIGSRLQNNSSECN